MKHSISLRREPESLRTTPMSAKKVKTTGPFAIGGRAVWRGDIASIECEKHSKDFAVTSGCFAVIPGIFVYLTITSFSNWERMLSYRNS